ncbi:MAG: class I SAM-dependent methyltransferase [Planctomycetaceae bacterium]
MSALKKMIPESLKQGLRPLYNSLKKSMQKCAAAFTPAPNEWKNLKEKMRGNFSSAELYAISQEAFGVLQQEEEIVGVLDYIAEPNPKVIGEIGLKHSGNSFLFTQKCRGAQQYLGLDLKLENTDKLQYVAPDGMKFRFFEGNSYAPETVGQVESFLAGRQFDFLFIDGDHSFHGVKEDFLMYLPMVRPGGLVGFHDIVPDEVARHGVKPEESLCYGGDVYAFWAELKQHFEHREFVKSWDQIGFGIGIITLPKEPLTKSQIDELRQKLVMK